MLSMRRHGRRFWRGKKGEVVIRTFNYMLRLGLIANKSRRCGGPRLESFSGLSTQLTPKARLNTFLGYQAPFDRHDWVVNRCGTRVDYVIDFYSGRDEGKPGKSLNFYLDVRPKLNTLEGWKMRAGRLVG